MVLKRSDGLLAWQKLLCQFVVTGIFAFYMIRYTDVTLELLLPFSGGKALDIGWLAIPLLFIVVLAAVNGVNFTDGLDGLASSVTVMVAVFFTVVAVGHAERDSPDYLRGCGKPAGLSAVQRIPGQAFSWETPAPWLWAASWQATAYMLNMPLFHT